MGTPSKLTEDKIDIIRKASESGLSFETLAARLGVHYSTMRRWYRIGEKEARRRQRGRDADPTLDLHIRFYEAWDTGLGELEQTSIDIIKGAAKSGVWQAAAWLLERKFPDNWSNVARDLMKEIKKINKRLDEEERRARRDNPWYGQEREEDES